MVANKLSLTQKKRYDINHKILESLANLESRIIIFSIVKESKTAESIAFDEKLPQSSVYSKLRDLENLGLICVDDIEKTSAGRITKKYRSRISGVTMNLKSTEPKFKLNPVPK